MRVLTLVLALGLTAACYSEEFGAGGPDIVVDQLEPGALHIGVMLPLADGTGVSQRDAVLLAVDAVNGAGLPGGLRVKPIIVESQPVQVVGRADVDAEVRRRVDLMEAHGVPALVVGGDRAAAVATPEAVLGGLTIISFSATAAALGNRAHPFAERAFRLAPPVRLIGGVMAGLARDAGRRRLAVIQRQGDPFGNGLGQAVEEAHRLTGGAVLDPVLLDAFLEFDHQGRLGQLLEREPDVIVPALSAIDMARVVNEVAALGGRPGWLLPHTAVGPTFIGNVAAPAALSGALAVAPVSGQGDGHAWFAARMEERFGHAVGAFDALAFDAVALLALASARALREPRDGNPVAGAELPRHIRAVANGPGRRLGPAELREALGVLAAGDEIEWTGAWADFDLASTGEPLGELALQIYSFDAATKGFAPLEVRTVRSE
jgi:branched-chain amino acid transport system substrate-binding protein